MSEWDWWKWFYKIVGCAVILAIVVALNIWLFTTFGQDASADDAGTWQLVTFDGGYARRNFAEWIVTVPETCDVQTVNTNNRAGAIIAYYRCP